MQVDKRRSRSRDLLKLLMGLFCWLRTVLQITSSTALFGCITTQIFRVAYRDSLTASGSIIIPCLKRLMNRSLNSLAFSQVASSMAKAFHFTKFSLTNWDPFFIQWVSKIASRWRMILPSSLVRGRSVMVGVD